MVPLVGLELAEEPWRWWEVLDGGFLFGGIDCGAMVVESLMKML